MRGGGGRCARDSWREVDGVRGHLPGAIVMSGRTHNGAAAGISATRDVSRSSLHFLSILCHKTFHSFAANKLTSSHAKKKSKSVGQFVRYNQFCDVMFTRFLAEIRHMFGNLSKPHL